jgi:hypothetical protein
MTTTHVPQCQGDYNYESVQREIERDPRIKGKEAKSIHRLLKGRERKKDETTSETILAQLGGAKFISMTGAKTFVGRDNGLQFKIPASKDGINAVIITVNARDYYDVEYYKIRGTKVVVVRSDTDVPADMLASSFELATGLYTKLF